MVRPVRKANEPKARKKESAHNLRSIIVLVLQSSGQGENRVNSVGCRKYVVNW
jgi:hypothetical protein